MCKDSGFNVMINEQRWASRNYEPHGGRGVGVYFYAVADNAEWRSVAAALLARFEARWGDKVRFIDANGYVVPKPVGLFGEE
jgi:hypothetical protein